MHSTTHASTLGCKPIAEMHSSSSVPLRRSSFSETFSRLRKKLPLGSSCSVESPSDPSASSPPPIGREIDLGEIEVGENDAVFYAALSRDLPLGGSLVHNGVSMTKAQLMSCAVCIEPTNVSYLLAFAASFRGRATCLQSGEYVSKQQIYKTILNGVDTFDPPVRPEEQSYCLFRLAASLPQGGWVALDGGKRLNRTELLVASVHLNPRNAEAFYVLSECLNTYDKSSTRPAVENSDYVILPGETGMLKRMSRRDLLLQSLKLTRDSSEALCSLATTIPEESDYISLRQNSLSKVDLLKRAIAVDPFMAKPYYQLASTLSKREQRGERSRCNIWLETSEALTYSVTLDNGRLFAIEDLFEKAILLAPEDAHCYYTYGKHLTGETANQPRSLSTTLPTELFLKAISLDPHFAKPYLRLAALLADGAAVLLPPNNTKMTKIALIKRAVALNPFYYDAFCMLGTTLPEGVATILEDGTIMSSTDLFKRAIELNPRRSEAYAALASVMSGDGSTVDLEDGTRVTSADIAERALACEGLLYGHTESSSDDESVATTLTEGTSLHFEAKGAGGGRSRGGGGGDGGGGPGGAGQRCVVS